MRRTPKSAEACRAGRPQVLMHRDYFFAALRRVVRFAAGFLAAAFFLATFFRFGAAFFAAGFLAATFFRFGAAFFAAFFFVVVFFAAALRVRFGAAFFAADFLAAATVRFFGARLAVPVFFATRRFLAGMECHPLSYRNRKV